MQDNNDPLYNLCEFPESLKDEVFFPVFKEMDWDAFFQDFQEWYEDYMKVMKTLVIPELIFEKPNS
jgi:hypothetical protein